MIPRSLFERSDGVILWQQDYQLSEDIREILVANGTVRVPNTAESDEGERWFLTDNFEKWYLGSQTWTVIA